MNRPLKDVDTVDRAFRLRALAFALMGGAVGLFGGGFGAAQLGLPVAAGALGGYVISVGVIYGGAMLLVGRAVRLGQILYAPSGRSTPARPEYSFAESLAVRGQYERALQAYAACCEEVPQDPEPALRAARLLRDELGRPDEAVDWFERARTAADASRGTLAMATREIIDLYTGPLDRPASAVPELVRLAREFRGTEIAAAAARELRALKRALADAREGG